MNKKLLLIALAFGNLFLANSQNDCASALTASAGITTVGTINGTLVDVCGDTYDSDAAEWYVYSPTISGLVTITSNLPQNDGVTNNDDTWINLYTGTCGALTCVAYNDDINANYLSSLTFAVQPGETYYVEWTNEYYDLGFDFEIIETPVTCPGTVTPPFTEDFTTYGISYVCWESLDEDGDGYNWEEADYDLDDDNIPDGNPCLKSASYDNDSGDALNPDNWIISYPIDLTSFSSGTTIELSWLARGIDDSFADENYSVYVATSNTTTDFLASPTSFTEIIGQNGGDGVFVSRALDISSFYGQTIYVAFRHHNSYDEYELNIDDVAVTTTLSAPSFATNELTIFPNPVLDVLNISSNTTLINSVKIADINGRTVKQVESNETNTKINVSDLTAGIYLVTIESDNGATVQKFVKQ